MRRAPVGAAPSAEGGASVGIADPGSLPAAAAPAGVESFTVIPFESLKLGDGRGANRPWLQELPDPLSTVMWGSWAEVATADADRLGIRTGDIVRLTGTAADIELPAIVLPTRAARLHRRAGRRRSRRLRPLRARSWRQRERPVRRGPPGDGRGRVRARQRQRAGREAPPAQAKRAAGDLWPRAAAGRGHSGGLGAARTGRGTRSEAGDRRGPGLRAPARTSTPPGSPGNP